MKKLVFSILLGSTALAPAFAQGTGQEAQTQTQAATNACSTLTVLMTENNDLDIGVERAQLQQWQANRNDRACAEQLAELEREHPREVAEARESAQAGNQQRAEAGDSVGGRIVVDPAEPQVTVQQPDPQISVSDPQPRVNVDQAAPRIVVEQQQPTVRIQIPRPVVTIEQPRPNIRVEMPEPEVAVSDARPRVSVDTPQPRVQVSQGQPDVRLQLEEPDVAVRENEQAQVTVERGEAVVRSDADRGQPEVNISQAEPQVSYEEAEPRVVLEEVPAPEVRYSQTGETQVDVNRAGEQNREQASNEEREQTNQNRQQASAEAERQQEQRVVVQQPEQARPSGDVEATASAGATSVASRMISVDQMMDTQIIGAQGEAIGDVENIVLMPDERTYAIVGVGGFLSLGERQVAIPLENITYRGDELYLRNMTEDQVRDMPEYQEGQGQALGRGETYEISTE